MIKIEINGLEFLVKSNLSVLEACKFVGITIPRFCYHETLSVAGNCRMCLVEIGNSPKPVASCALPIINNMKIFVNTPLVKKARENVLESLLLNHPLDCPICDQGGECDLQDQAKIFGTDYSRFFFNKRGVEDKYCGPLIKTIMTRCIHCTRCVRFSTEIAGVDFFGTLNRGVYTEIGSYTPSFFLSEISGNVIDLCPVGALTAKPYAFKARPWELRLVENIDVLDSLGSNVYVQFKESEIMRVIPKINNCLNETIITDKARFSYDSNHLQRIQKIFKLNNTTEKTIYNWEQFLIKIDQFFLLKKKVIILITSNLDFQSLIFLKNLENTYQDFIKIRVVETHTLNSNININHDINTVAATMLKSEVSFLISTNLKLENAILNTKLRIKEANNDILLFGFNLTYKTNYPIHCVNLNINVFKKFLLAKSNVSKYCINFKNPIFYLGSLLYTSNITFNYIFSTLKIINPSSIILNIEKTNNSASIGLLNIATITSSELNNALNIFAINLPDTLNIVNFLNKKKIFWFNTHGSSFALKANYIIPLASHYEEEDNYYLNLEKRLQKNLKIFKTIGNARSFKNFISLYNKKPTIDLSIFFVYQETINDLIKFNTKKLQFTKLLTSFSKMLNFKLIHQLSIYPIKLNSYDFYLSTKWTKTSNIMLNCSIEMRKKNHNFNF